MKSLDPVTEPLHVLQKVFVLVWGLCIELTGIGTPISLILSARLAVTPNGYIFYCFGIKFAIRWNIWLSPIQYMIFLIVHNELYAPSVGSKDS